LLKERVSFLPDFAEMSGYFFADPEHYDENMAKKRWDENSKDYLMDLKQRWSDSAAWEADKLREAFDQLIADGELNKGKVLAPLRLALTGVPSGPGVFEIAEVIGKEASLRRIDQAAERLGGGKKGVEV
jgi:glutamyl-tRNA synthetase